MQSAETAWRAKAQATVSARTVQLTRFANNAIHQNVASREATLQIRVVKGKRVSTIRTSDIGEEGIARVRDLTAGGSPIVLEAVGHLPAYEQAVGVVRPGGVISRVGVPQYEEAPIGFGSLFGRNITLTGGPAPVRAYIERLLPAVLDGTLEPGRVFDATVDLEDTPKGYAAMDERAALKVLVQP